MKWKYCIITSLAGISLPVSLQASLLAYDGFTQGTNGQPLAGYQGTSQIGLSGPWSRAAGGDAWVIRNGSGGQWGTPMPNWPALEHTSWTVVQGMATLNTPINLTVDGTYYISYLVECDSDNHVSEVGLLNSSTGNELMAGNAWNWGGLTAFYGTQANAISTPQTGYNGTTISSWTTKSQWQAVIELDRTGGNLDATISYYPGAYSPGPAAATRTVQLGALSDTFDKLAIQYAGWGDLDEIHVGTTLADVVPVPEPATLNLVGVLGGLMLILRRRSLE